VVALFSTSVLSSLLKTRATMYHGSVVKWLKIESRRGEHKSTGVRDQWRNMICNDFLHNRLIEIIQSNTYTCACSIVTATNAHDSYALTLLSNNPTLT